MTLFGLNLAVLIAVALKEDAEVDIGFSIGVSLVLECWVNLGLALFARNTWFTWCYNCAWFSAMHVLGR